MVGVSLRSLEEVHTGGVEEQLNFQSKVLKALESPEEHATLNRLRMEPPVAHHEMQRI